MHSTLLSATGLLIVGISMAAIPQALPKLTIFMSESALTALLRRHFGRTDLVGVDFRCPHCGVWIDATAYRHGATAYLCGSCRQELPVGTVTAARRNASARSRSGSDGRPSGARSPSLTDDTTPD